MLSGYRSAASAASEIITSGDDSTTHESYDSKRTRLRCEGWGPRAWSSVKRDGKALGPSEAGGPGASMDLAPGFALGRTPVVCAGQKWLFSFTLVGLDTVSHLTVQ